MVALKDLTRKTTGSTSEDDVNVAYFRKQHGDGYGLVYPDGHIIRGWEYVIKSRIRTKNPRLLDFGCWDGTHARYFHSKGFDVYGVDIVDKSVELAKKIDGIPLTTFIVLKNRTKLEEVFDSGFDVILSNQVLYYLDDETLENRLLEFRKLLNPGGYVFFTMMSRLNFFFMYSDNVVRKGLEKISLPASHRWGGLPQYLRGVDSIEHLKSIFGLFVPVSLGKYDVCFDLAESSEHFIFIGQ